ncbi:MULTISPECIES: SRPBCC family protein [Enterococcus]|uniref:SRPBCC family protein n=1 Tax=Enterococcus alcedinis TaxID=1274384 RepID=A0A917JDX0_9ENTE|nr:SRPBCC family protein [Enterococcus alcedinis]MBP2101876.1 putative SprT family Zn-dependent metalloprotease [Enterococcus alcedinis]GGI65438.1 hypothetical protein GCM10011482_10920 [Enterococcus alcedinis]
MSWESEMTIHANIETVWQLFTEENMQRIMPQVVAHKLVSTDPITRTNIYEETYAEGKREETYLLTEIILLDTPTEKHKSFDFTIAKMIHSMGEFQLKKITDTETLFIYRGKNEGVNFLGKTMLKIGSQKKNDEVVENFVQLVKKEAEKDEMKKSSE